MGLFSKNEIKDMEQTQEIKEAASNIPQIPIPVSSTTSTELPPSIAPALNQQQSQQEFVNPFANQQQANTTIDTMEKQQSINHQDSQPNPFSQQQSEQSTAMNSNLDEDAIRELIVENVEKIIDERWERVTSSVESVVGWKDKVEREIDLLKHDISAIKEGFEQFEKRLLNKVNSYDRNILDVNSEIKALEKVFNKITPTLVNNVNELSKIADNLRGVKHDTPEQK